MGLKDGVYTVKTYGGVPIGIDIAQDIFNSYVKKGAEKPSSMGPSFP